MTRLVYDRMIAHSHESLPAEAVGMLGGSDGQALKCIPLANLLGARRFLADPYSQFLALRQFSAEGFTPLAVYHSHPGGGVTLSAEDLQFARRLPYLQLVIALARSHNPALEVACYAVGKNGLEEIGLDIERP